MLTVRTEQSMNLYENDALPAIAMSVTDVSIGVVLALSAIFLFLPFVMLAGLVYSGIRERTRKGRQ
jgi:hypothetical protein